MQCLLPVGKLLKMKKLLPFLLVGLMAVNLLNFSSAESLGTFEQNGCIQLIQTCEDCTYVNISSVLYPNSSQALGEAAMTKTGTFYNYTFCDTSNLGNYIVNGHGDTLPPVWHYSFTITPTGLEQSTAQGLGSLAFLALYCVLTIVLGIVGWKLTETKYLWILGIFIMFLAALFLVYDVFLGYEYHSAITGFTDSNVPQFMFYGLLLVVVIGLLVSGILLFTYWETLVSYIKKELKTRKNDDPTDELENVSENNLYSLGHSKFLSQ